MLTAIISVCALLVSLYGIRERRTEVSRAQRVRLAQLADALNEVQIAVDNEDGEHSGYQLRRELLAQQAATLTGVSKGKVSSIESRSIAIACRAVGDEDSARSFYETAVTAASREGKAYLVHALRAYADYLFELGEVVQGREYYRRAWDEDKLALNSTSQWRLMETASWWGENEATTTAGGSRERATELLAEAERLARALPTTSQVEGGLEVVAASRQAAFGKASKDGRDRVSKMRRRLDLPEISRPQQQSGAGTPTPDRRTGDAGRR